VNKETVCYLAHKDSTGTTKAFDTIVLGILLQKLMCYIVSGPEILWFTDCLFNKSQYG